MFKCAVITRDESRLDIGSGPWERPITDVGGRNKLPQPICSRSPELTDCGGVGNVGDTGELDPSRNELVEDRDRG